MSPIVIAIFVLATTLLVLGERRDAWFISVVIIVNTLFAIVQEVRAQRALKRLELMSAPRARRLRDDGSYDEVLFSELAADDTIRLLAGDEIPADATILSGAGLEIDESILTGESSPVEKLPNDGVFAGTIVVAGSAEARVVAVGVESKAGQMTATLKRYEPQLTPLQRAIDRAITFLTYGALALAALIFIVYISSGQDAVSIFKTITSAAVTVVPEGLILASSLLLALGSLKLARAKVLPQKLAAIEAMALLSVLCVDKTGTLTSDVVTFETFNVFEGVPNEKWNDIAAVAAVGTGAGNATAEAIVKGLKVPSKYKITDTLAFSSERKMSGVRMVLSAKTHTVLMGAPDFLEKLAPLTTEQKSNIHELTSQGRRVLMLASFSDHDAQLKEIKPKSGVAIGLIVLNNPLRTGVEKTVAYLQKNGVSMRVISGDNPSTVQYVAQHAGIINSDKVMLGSDLAKLNDKAWDRAVLDTVVFARVLPEQKERLVATFQKHGQFTGMVGDGVNDALALKKADLGVAMFAGAAATRRVADIVLLNNSFTSMPLGMNLGNRIMQAIELIAVLFFHKIIFGVVLLLSTLAIGMVYPFAPRHVTFMNMFLVTMPTLMWTLFPPLPRHRVNPKHFWRDTLGTVAPIATLSGVAVTSSYWILTNLHPQQLASVTTLTVIIATFFGVYLVFLASRMLGVVYDRAAMAARVLYVAAAVIVGIASFGFNFLRDFFDFTQPNWIYSAPVLAIVVVAAILQYILAVHAGNKLRQKHYTI